MRLYHWKVKTILLATNSIFLELFSYASVIKCSVKYNELDVETYFIGRGGEGHIYATFYIMVQSDYNTCYSRFTIENYPPMKRWIRKNFYNFCKGKFWFRDMKWLGEKASSLVTLVWLRQLLGRLRNDLGTQP